MAENGSTDSDNENDDDDKNLIDDVDDDELERLARINAKFNSNNLTQKPLEPKGMSSYALIIIPFIRKCSFLLPSGDVFFFHPILRQFLIYTH
jgi:hypothetical protein